MSSLSKRHTFCASHKFVVFVRSPRDIITLKVTAPSETENELLASTLPDILALHRSRLPNSKTHLYNVICDETTFILTDNTTVEPYGPNMFLALLGKGRKFIMFLHSTMEIRFEPYSEAERMVVYIFARFLNF